MGVEGGLLVAASKNNNVNVATTVLISTLCTFSFNLHIGTVKKVQVDLPQSENPKLKML